MKLDKDLVRKILLKLEEDQSEPREIVNLQVSGHTHREISYHVQLLSQAGFVKAIDASSFDGEDWKPQHLTYEGHEFLDTVRDPQIWRETKDMAGKVGAVSVQMLWEIGKAVLKAKAATLGISL